MPGTEVEERQDRVPVHVPGMPQARRRESEALPVRAFRSARRNRHVSVPLAVPPAVWTAAEIMHAYGMGGYAGVAGLVLAGSVWYFAPRKWDRAAEVWYARASAAALWLWLWAAASLGATSGTQGEALGPLLLALAAAWGVPWYRHKRPRGMKKRERLLRQWQQWWAFHSPEWGLAGSRVIEAEEAGVIIRLRVQLWAGRQSEQHVKGSVHLIESALEGFAAAGMVGVRGVKGNASQVDVRLKRDNPLREPVEWDRALAPRSVHEDALQGLTESSSWKRVAQRVNSFVIGATRTGKSNDLLLHVAQLAGCPDARIVVIDLKRRSARPLLESAAVDCVITDVAEARMYLRMVAAEIAARSAGAYDGEEQLLATPEVPALFTFCDEVNPLASVAGGDPECARLLAVIASQGSGLEVYLRVYTQYGALEESVQTEQTRGNLRLRVCYRVEESRHGSFVIPEYARLDASKLEEQGTSYVKDAPETFPEQVRAPKMSHDAFRADAAATAPARARRPPWVLYCAREPSPVQGLAWGEWWARRHLRTDPRFRSVSPQYADAVRRYGEPEEDAASAAPAPPPAAAAGTDTGAAVAARIEEEAGGPDIAPTAAGEARARGAVARGRGAFCAALAAAGRDGISPGALMEASGMSRSWVHDMLARLEGRDAVVKPGRGRYSAVPGADVAGALQAVEAGDAALLGGDDAVQRLRLVHPAS